MHGSMIYMMNQSKIPTLIEIPAYTTQAFVRWVLELWKAGDPSGASYGSYDQEDVETGDLIWRKQ